MGPALETSERDLAFAGDITNVSQSTLDEPRHPQAQLLLNYWRQCMSRGGCKIGRDVPNREIASVLSNICVLEPIGAEDYYLRLVGNIGLRRFSKDVSHRKLSEILDGENMRAAAGKMSSVLATSQPLILLVGISTTARLISRESVVLPVSAPDGRERWILIGTFYFD